MPSILDVAQARAPGYAQYVSGEKNGDKVAQDSLKKQTVTIAKDTITLKGDDKFVIKYERDAGKAPVVVKMTITESPFGAGAKAVGILQLKGDVLRICYSPETDEAPKAFETKGGKAHLFVLKRAKE